MTESTESTLAAVAARVEELGAMCERLARENDELQRMVAAPAGRVVSEQSSSPSSVAVCSPAADLASGVGSGPVPDVPADRRMNRRTLGKFLGATAAGVVGAAALTEIGASPAAASDGNAVTAGDVTTAEARTSVLYDGASGFGGVVLLGNDSTYSGSSAGYPAALAGWAGAGATAGKGGVPSGIYGFTDNGDGYGVVGVNSGLVAGSGAGVLGTASGADAIGVEGVNSVGTAIAGRSDSTASVATAIIGTIASTSPGGFSAAVRGVNNGTGGLGIGVWGSQAGSGWGMYATSESGVGVVAAGGTGTGVASSGETAVAASGTSVGLSASGATAVAAEGSGAAGVAVSALADSSQPTVKITNTGSGRALLVGGRGSLAAVYANNTGAGAAMYATAVGSDPAIDTSNQGAGPGLQAQSATGRGALFSGKAAQIQLTPGTGASHPTNGEKGDLYVDTSGRLWFCKLGGIHLATWVQVA